MNKRYRVTLTPQEREDLTALVSKGTAKARRLAHARVLLQADESEGAPALTDDEVAAAVLVSARTVERVRRLFVEQGPDAALRTHVPGARLYAAKFDGRDVLVAGMPGATVAVTRTDVRAFDVVIRNQGATTYGHNEISADGRTRTVTQKLVIGGREATMTLVYERVP